jgi:formylglycine-generating enzyme required for sulfatase activity
MCCVALGLGMAVLTVAGAGTEADPTQPMPGRLPRLVLDLGSSKLELVRIPAGRFQMGSSDADPDAEDDEKPRHEVALTRAFYLGRCEVTRGQFRAFVEAANYRTEAERAGRGSPGYNAEKRNFFRDARYGWRDPGFAQTDAHPVVDVSWNDAVAFCDWLSRKTGRPCGLPTEAQWEYACRGGTRTRYYHGADENGLKTVANLADLSLKPRWDYLALNRQRPIAHWFERVSWDDGYPFTAPVGSFQPNQNGLYDMHGNVWEWCADRYDGAYYRRSAVTDPPGPEQGWQRSLRGGAWDNAPRYCRSASRHKAAPSLATTSFGFRVCIAAGSRADR